MASQLLEDLKAQASRSGEPRIAPMPSIRLGGVDPLGLRQINFDLMDEVLPGLNNVARHIRPFVVVAWAWRRASQIALTSGKKTVDVDVLHDFVDRIEVIYGWSQFLLNPASDLPGRDVLNPLVKLDRYTFSGERWKTRRAARKDSTAFMAAINYGPALKSMGWLHPNPEEAKVFVAADWVQPALNSFEKKIAGELDHPVFKQFGKVTASSAEVTKWGRMWALEKFTKAEQRAVQESLCGSRSPKARQLGMELVIAVAQSSSARVSNIRKRMSGSPSRFKASSDQLATVLNWRRVQLRQLFRLCLEAALFWSIGQLQRGPAPTKKLVSRFLRQAKTGRSDRSAEEWLQSHFDEHTGPVELIESLQVALQDEEWDPLARSIVGALAFCMLAEVDKGKVIERPDRLPLVRARREYEQRHNIVPAEFLKHFFESWIFAQHVYWSVGRGLADARARGKSILRLKVVLEDGGWALAPGVSSGSFPIPTADRLQTALSLAHECGLIEEAPQV